MDNKFGKVSRISACAALKDGKTILEDLSFTAPYKIMTPFEKENGGITNGRGTSQVYTEPRAFMAEI